MPVAQSKANPASLWRHREFLLLSTMRDMPDTGPSDSPDGAGTASRLDDLGSESPAACLEAE